MSAANPGIDHHQKSESAERPAADMSEITLVVLNVVFDQELYEFIPERNLVMVPLWARNLHRDCVTLRLAYSEGPVTAASGRRPLRGLAIYKR